MVRFAPAISSAVVTRSQENNHRARAARNKEVSGVASEPNGRPQKLPSLYPTISLKSLRSREITSDVDLSPGTSNNTDASETQSSLDVVQQSAESISKLKGTSLVVGAAGILRAATVFAVNNTTAKTTVHQAEEQIEEPECQTFLVLATRLGRQYVFRFSKEKSLFLFGPFNTVRRAIIILITNQFFELFILLTIIVNCVFLALKNSPEEPEYVFAAIYTIEMILKIIAKGFCMHKFAYLRDPWNWLDFVVVILGYITLIPNVYNLSGIRTFRVLRALRTISTVEGLKTMVNALLKSMLMLSDVLILTLFFLCIFALVGMQLFVGQLRNKCITSNGEWLKSDEDEPLVCGNASTARHCPTNYTCLSSGENPNYGYTNFENFAWSLVTAFQLITMDFWENVFNYVLSAMGSWYVFYFMFAVFFGSFYLINLVLAVVAVSYQQEVVAMQQRDSEHEELIAVMSTYSFHGQATPKLLENGKLKREALAKKWKLSLCVPCLKRTSRIKVPETKITIANASHVSLGNGSRMAETNAAFGEYYTVSNNIENANISSKNKPKGKELKLTPVTLYQRQQQQSCNTSSVNNDISRIPETATNSKFLDVKPSWERTLSVINENESSHGDSQCSNENDDKEQNKISFPVTATGISPSGRPAESMASLGRLDSQENASNHKTELLSRRKRIRKRISQLIMDPLFDMSITLCILLNTVFLSLEYHGMNSDFKLALNIGNMVFTFVFFMEMVLKLVALGLRGYCKTRWNIFDGFIVVISIVDLILELANIGSGAELSVLRTFRLLRVFKLAQSWQTMNMLLRTIASSIGQLGNLTLVLGIIVYILAVVGMQIFGSSYTKEKFDGEIPRWNFNDFGHAFMMIFRILCGEWIEPLYDSMRATSPASFLFFLTALVIGNFLVLNLFLALLLNAFARESLQEEAEKRKEARPSKFYQGVQRLSKVLRIGNMLPRRGTQVNPQDTGVQELAQEETTKDSRKDVLPGSTALLNAVTAFQKKGKLNRATMKRLSIAIEAANKDSNASSTVLNLARTSAPSPSPRRSVRSYPSDAPTVGDPAMSEVQECCPCWMKFCTCSCIATWKESRGYRKWRSMRHNIKKFVEHRYFDWLILVIIISSSVTLVFEDVHLDSSPKLKKWLNYLNIVFAVVFSLEFLLKTLGLGFLTYFKNLWNCLDVIIVTISILTAVESVEELTFITSASFANETADNSDSSLSSFRSLRTLRALRPLRAISRWEGMKVVVNSLLFAIPGIGNVLLVCMVFWLIFSIVGVQFFGGKFFRCVDIRGKRLPVNIVANKTECSRLRYRWINANINFDNVINGLIALFQVATFEGWMEIMRDAVDSQEIDEQPKSNNRFASYLYFVIFIIVGSFFTLNLFIGVIIDNFNRLKKQYEDSGVLDVFLTPSQKAWFNTLKKAANKKPKKMISRPKVKWQAGLFDIIHSSKFETFIMILICFNMLVMMIQHYGQSREVELTMNIINLVFTAIFTLEAIARIVALRLHFFKQSWNIFDFTIVILSIIDLVRSVKGDGKVMIDKDENCVSASWSIALYTKEVDGTLRVDWLHRTLQKSALLGSDHILRKVEYALRWIEETFLEPKLSLEKN